MAVPKPSAPGWERVGKPLENLGEEERRVLAYACALGKEFDFPLLRTACGLPEEEVAEILERLVHRGVLRERPGGDRFSFVQEEARVRVYREMTESRIRVIHRKIAEAYEALYPNPPSELLSEFGRHFFLGRVHDKSYQYNRRAAAVARRALAPEIAAHHLERARADLRELPGDHREEEAQLLLELGEIAFLLSDDARAETLYAEALAAIPADRRVLRALALLARSEVARQQADHPKALSLSREAAGLLEAEGHRRGLARVHRIAGRIAFQEGDPKGALEAGRHALELLDPQKDALEIARCHIDMGNAQSSLGSEHVAEGVKFYELAIEELAKLEDWPEQARACNNLAVAIGTESPARALEWLEKGRVLAERGHDRRMMGWTLFNSVEFHLVLGQIDEGERANREARKILERLVDPVALQQISLNDGLLALKKDRRAEAAEHFRRALVQAQELKAIPQEAEMYLRLAHLHALQGELEEARTELQRSEALDVATLMPTLDRLRSEVRELLGAPGGSPGPSPATGRTADGPAPP